MARKFDQIWHAPKPTNILKSAVLVLASGLFFADSLDMQAAVFLGDPFTLTDPQTTATPYPGNIVVANLETIPLTGSNVTLTINSFARSGRPDDLDMLLVAPTAGANLIVWSDVGGTGGATGTLTITLSDSGASFLPDAGPLASGTFKPTNQSTVQDSFPAPAPAGPYGNPGPAGAGTSTFASEFNGTNPNGTWSLYIIDDAPNSGGETTTIGSWSLDINAPVIPEPSTLALIALGSAPLLGLLRRKKAS